MKRTVLIQSLDDIQRLLDNNSTMNLTSVTGLIELVADDYYVTSADLGAVGGQEMLNYLWDPTAEYINGWTFSYQNPVYYANVILDEMPSIQLKENERSRYEELRASALFFRAWAFYHLAQLYCQPYSQENLQQPGIVLRLTSAILDKSERATVKQTYDQVIKDLQDAAAHLPENSSFPTRPNKAAAFGALARVCLNMRAYADAGRYADSCLVRNNQLMDYNTIDPNADVPFPRFNKETIFYNILPLQSLLTMNTARIDSLLIRSYSDDDLRKVLFYNPNGDGSFQCSGTYEGNAWVSQFNGIATDEIFLIRAEAAARAGNTAAAMDALNHLLKHRWKSSVFVPRTAATAGEALKIILEERRKELVFRGIRWTDLRRLNEEGAGYTLKREYNGNIYTLPPKDLRWVLLIPRYIIGISGIAQNPR